MGRLRTLVSVFKHGLLLNRPTIKGKSAILRHGTSASGPVGLIESGGFPGGSTAAT